MTNYDPTTHHQRGAHPRHNPSGTVSHIPDVIAKNPGSHTPVGVPRVEAEAHTDALMGLIDAEETFDDLEGPIAEQELSEAEREESASLLNRLMGDRVVDTRGNPLEEQSARLLTIKSLIERLQIELEDEGEVDDIVFALEASDWTTNGFDRKSHLPWAALGLDADTATRWRDAGFTPYNVGEWLSGSYYGRIEPEDAKHYAKEGVDVATARRWSQYDFKGEDAVGWIKAQLEIHEAARWRQADVNTVHEYNDWQELGVHQAGDVSILKSLGSEAAQRWIDADVELADAVAWNKYVKDGYSEKDLATFASRATPINIETFEPWQEAKIPASEVAGFMEKGYTPKRALSRIKKGQNAAQAEDLRGKEKVPGKAWKEIKSSISATARSEGAAVIYDDIRRNGDYGVTMEVTIREPENYSGSGYIRNRSYRVKFTNTGRFLSASGTGIEVRKVSDLINLI
jgi:hypothetical protein